MTNKSLYQQFCDRYELPIFYQSWWLDAVCGASNWGVVLSKKKDDQIVGVLPFFLSKMKGLPVSMMPLLTPTLGTWIIYPPQAQNAKLRSWEKRVVDDLIRQLPTVVFFQQKFHFRFQNWLPLYWQGYQQTTRYSYRIKDLSNIEQVYQNFAGRLRTTIRKAAEQVTIQESQDIDQFYQINQLSFSRQGKSTPYSLDFLKRLDETLQRQKQRTIYIAKDAAKNIHAALYIVWDTQMSYNLMAGGDPKFRNSGAMQLLLWQAIQDASRRGQAFDFEGSMIESIAFSFQSFGGELVPYYEIFKAKNRFYDLLWQFRRVLV